MTKQEDYKAGQEASGIEVGDTVIATRHFDTCEDGSTCCSSKGGPTKAAFIDEHREGIVSDVREDYIGVNHCMTFPYTALEIVKKAPGTVPDAKPITKGDSNMKTQEIYKYVVTENIKVKDDNGQIESNRKKILVSGTMPAYDEANVKIKAMQGLNLEGIDIDEVEVLVRPFCQKG